MNQQSVETVIRKELRSLLREDIGDDIDDIPIAELGVDSLDFFEMLVYLDEEYGIEIPIQNLNDEVTLRAVIGLVCPTSS